MPEQSWHNNNMLGLLNKKKSGPDFNDMDISEVNISGYLFQFAIPGNGSKRWGRFSPASPTLNLYDDGFKKGPLGFIEKTIRVEVWDYFGYFWQSHWGHLGDFSARWEIAQIQENHKGQLKDLNDLKEYLKMFYSGFYESPGGKNTQIRKRMPDWTDEELGTRITKLPNDYNCITINNRDWLWHSIWSETPGKTSWYYALPIAERYFLYLKFTFDVHDFRKKEIEAQQKEAAQKIASYMKVTFPDESDNNCTSCHTGRGRHPVDVE